MPDFSTLLSKSLDAVKKAPPLDAGNYPGVITGYEPGESREKKTPYVRFNLKLTGWPEGGEPQKRDDGTAMDLAGKTLRRDYFLTEDALWRLKEFLEDLGMNTAGQTFMDLLPKTIGENVLVEVKQYLGQDNSVGNDVVSLKGLH